MCDKIWYAMHIFFFEGGGTGYILVKLDKYIFYGVMFKLCT